MTKTTYRLQVLTKWRWRLLQMKICSGHRRCESTGTRTWCSRTSKRCSSNSSIKYPWTRRWRGVDDAVNLKEARSREIRTRVSKHASRSIALGRSRGRARFLSLFCSWWRWRASSHLQWSDKEQVQERMDARYAKRNLVAPRSRNMEARGYANR